MEYLLLKYIYIYQPFSNCKEIIFLYCHRSFRNIILLLACVPVFEKETDTECISQYCWSTDKDSSHIKNPHGFFGQQSESHNSKLSVGPRANKQKTVTLILVTLIPSSKHCLLGDTHHLHVFRDTHRIAKIYKLGFWTERHNKLSESNRKLNFFCWEEKLEQQNLDLM